MSIKCRLIEPIGKIYEVLLKTPGSDDITRIEIPAYGEGDFHRYSEQYKERFWGLSTRKRWNTEDGENNHPGDMYFADWMHDYGRCMYWDNCNDHRGHLVVVLPNGIPFDTNSRGSNCTMKSDRTHRCWVFEGEPALLNINGPKSENGAGSIQAGNWHGYIRNGQLVE